MILLIVTSPSLALIAIGGVPIVVIPIVFLEEKFAFCLDKAKTGLQM